MPYSLGESVSGTVSGVTDYGAFVRLADGSNGMIHISKLSNDYVSDIHSFIKKGDAVTATVIANQNGKIALSLVGDKQKKQSRPEKADFETMLSSFKSASDEKLSGLHYKERNKKRR